MSAPDIFVVDSVLYAYTPAAAVNIPAALLDVHVSGVSFENQRWGSGTFSELVTLLGLRSVVLGI